MDSDGLKENWQVTLLLTILPPVVRLKAIAGI